MPLIEELPTTTLARPSHGWAYIPVTDNAPLPIAAVHPGSRSNRKARTAASHLSTAHRAGTSAKQEKAIQARLDALNKENHRDGVNVPLPARPAERDAGRKRGKMTSNVRRILGYQRGFVHWLGEEEANAANTAAPVSAMPPPMVPASGSGTSTPTSAPGSKKPRPSRASTTTSQAQTPTHDATMTEAPSAASARKNRAMQRAKATASKTASNTDVEKSSSPAPSPVKAEPQPTQSDTPMTDVKDAAAEDAKPSKPAHPYPESYDKNPLLKTLASEVPPNPTERVMQLFLAEPPLSYSAARAKPLDADLQKPPRHFCGVCGYWGRVRCKGCGDWTCGIMECWKGHQGVCSAAV